MPNKPLAVGLALLALPAFSPAFNGPLPADNVSIRGYAMPSDSAGVLAQGAWSYGLGFDAANYWTYESSGYGYVRQIFETQTLAFELRRGFSGTLPIEAGLRLSAQQSGQGMLNGFIGGFETGMASLFNSDIFINSARSGPQPLKGSSDIVAAGGKLREREADTAVGAGDSSLTLKMLAYRGPGPTLSPRLFLNLPTAAIRSSNAFAGLGLAVEVPTLSERLLLHGDLRLVLPFASQDDLGLSLVPLSAGGTFGLEWMLGGLGFIPQNLSLGLHYNLNQSPYAPVGLRAYDTPENDLAVGLSQGFSLGALKGKWQLWGREDFFFYGPNGRTYWFPYAPPDFQSGLKLTFY